MAQGDYTEQIRHYSWENRFYKSPQIPGYRNEGKGLEPESELLSFRQFISLLNAPCN